MIVNGKYVQSIIHNGNSISKLIRNGVELYREIKPIARYSAKGRTNQDADRETLWDLSGNGYDIKLNNFGFIDGSGYSNDSLVFDGVDDYGICNNVTAGGEYTVITKRTYPTLTKSSVFLSKRGIPSLDNYGEFVVEKRNWDGKIYSNSYGSSTNIFEHFNSGTQIIIQQKNAYNNFPINSGTHKPNNLLLIGAGLLRVDGSTDEFANVAVHDLLIYNSILTKEEIQSEILKYNL